MATSTAPVGALSVQPGEDESTYEGQITNDGSVTAEAVRVYGYRKDGSLPTDAAISANIASIAPGASASSDASERAAGCAVGHRVRCAHCGGHAVGVTWRIGALLAVALLSASCSGGAESESEAASESAAPKESAADETAEPTESAAEGGTATSVFDLEVGDCYDTTTTTDVETVDVLDCEAPHDYEVYALVQHSAGPGEEYPGDDAISDFADDACLGNAFEDYVGRSFQDSELFAFALQPTAETWDVGDREVVCAAFLKGEKLEGSVEGSER